MNEEEFGFRKLLKLRYKREDQIIKTFSKIGFPPEIRSPFFNLQKFQNSEKITPEPCKMH